MKYQEEESWDALVVVSACKCKKKWGKKIKVLP